MYGMRFFVDRSNLVSARSEIVEQLVSDIASYYGYNDFLTEKLFQLFPVAEVCPTDFLTWHMYADNWTRPLSSSMQMKSLVRLPSGRTLSAPDVEIWRKR